MDESLCEDEFFIIDTNNMDQITTSFYGFSVGREGFVNTDINKKEELTPDGAYVFIDVSDGEINIHQDFIGSYGLYLFEEGNYFALSNSFIRLVDHVKESYEISLNRDFANDLFTSMTTHYYGGTLVNEIEFLPRDCIVKIDKANNKLGFEKITYNEHSVSLNSKEGVEILDGWYYKWIDIIRNIKARTNNFCVHLSGGFDTRIVAALWLSANINIDDVKVVSVNDDLHTHTEDYEIALQIADYFGFELNKGKIDESKVGYADIDVPLMNSFNLKLGFHNEMYFKPFRYENPLYAFTGSAGGLIRGIYDSTCSDFLDEFLKNLSYRDYHLVKSTSDILDSAFLAISDKYNLDLDSTDLFDYYYLEGRCRHHFGKGVVETYMSNEFSLTPLMDSDLYKLTLHDDICTDKKLLMAFIFVRYCPDLLNFKFEGNRGIDKETIDYARKINEQYPFERKEFEEIASPDCEISSNDANQDSCIQRKDIDNLLEEVFNSRAFEMEFKKYFSFKLYDEIYRVTKNTKYYPLRHVYSAVAVLKVANDVEISRLNRIDNEILWLNSFLDDAYAGNIIKHENKADLRKYAYARIDIKNYGEKNNVEIIENSDDYSRYTYPGWFRDEKGYGCVVDSYSGSIYLKVKCINKGIFRIVLRTLNFKDMNGKFPIYVNYRNLTVNGERLVSEKVITHDEPFRFEKEVEDGEIVEIYAEWNPINSSSSYVRKVEKVNKQPAEKIESDESSGTVHNLLKKLKR